MRVNSHIHTLSVLSLALQVTSREKHIGCKTGLQELLHKNKQKETNEASETLRRGWGMAQ